MCAAVLSVIIAKTCCTWMTFPIHRQINSLFMDNRLQFWHAARSVPCVRGPHNALARLLCCFRFRTLRTVPIKFVWKEFQPRSLTAKVAPFFNIVTNFVEYKYKLVVFVMGLYFAVEAALCKLPPFSTDRLAHLRDLST